MVQFEVLQLVVDVVLALNSTHALKPYFGKAISGRPILTQKRLNQPENQNVLYKETNLIYLSARVQC